MEIWPSNLVEELAYRRCIIFFGAGVSATAVKVGDVDVKAHPPTWGEFINRAFENAKYAKGVEKKYIKDKIKNGDYLAALQGIKDTSDIGEYNTLLRKTFASGNYVASDVHKAIKDIDCKITITTNFDKIYDNLCVGDGYCVHTYQNFKDITNNIKSPQNVIIKAHGTIDAINDIVFTARDYYESQEKYPDFYDVLFALFLTHTVLFLGYSLNDPDINLVLQYLHRTASDAAPHYMLMRSGVVVPQQKRFWKDTYNVQIIEYGNEYKDFPVAMEELSELVASLREERSIS